MSKRLEEIKELWEEDNHYCDPCNYEWLIEQAERVQELEEYKESYEGVARALDNMSETLLKERRKNKLYRESRDKLDAIFHEKHRPYPSEYEDGYIDGLDTAISIINKSLEE